MDIAILFFLTAFSTGVSVYAFNFARDLWKQGNKRGAVGVGLLIPATLLAPLYPIWRSLP